ncbi:MAG TPA: hypothetical protein PKI14_05025 [Fervidobacterium sp.]|nr:hypothetical protein [Fervidobacterium sp.]
MTSRIIKSYLKDLNTSLNEKEDVEVSTLFKLLFQKERIFASHLQSTGNGKKVYMKFIQRTADSDGGIKTARSYFRARQDSFLNTVNKAIRDVEPKGMYDVPINFKFCKFAVDNLPKPDQKIFNLYNDIKTIREDIITRYMHLSLHRAKLFTTNTTNKMGNLTFEDFIQAANIGLVDAVDKYVMENENEDIKQFHFMLIGRISSSLINEFNDASTDVSVGEQAQKRLYQIRRWLEKNATSASKADISKMSKDLEIQKEEIVDLLNATVSSNISLDSATGNNTDGQTTLHVDYFNPEDHDYTRKNNQEDVAIQNNMDRALRKVLNELSTLEKKILILKGVKINENY